MHFFIEVGGTILWTLVRRLGKAQAPDGAQFSKFNIDFI